MEKHPNEIIEALKEVLADAQGNARLKERVVDVEDVDVYQIRQKYRLTQLEFSKKFGFSLRKISRSNGGAVPMALLLFF